MGIKFTNNASANITHDLTADATSVTVSYGKGELFPSLASGDYFYATLAGNNGLEIVKVTARVLDTMTIVRAQDNTEALTFETGDLFELRVVAKSFEEFRDSIEDIQETAVHKTGNETIAGTKTFTSNIELSKTAGLYKVKSPTLDTTENSTTNKYVGGYELVDKNNNRIGILRGGLTSADESFMHVLAVQPGGNAESYVTVKCPRSGQPYATAPTTPADSKGNQIVTADWLAAHGGLASYAKDVGSADANTILSPGIYWLRSTSTNIPSGTNGILQVFVLKNLILRQVFWRQGTLNSNDHNIWTRQIELTDSGGIEEIGDWIQMLTSKGGTIKSTVPRLYFSDTDITKGTAPSATHALGMAFKDVAGTDGGTLLYSVYANGGTKLELSAYNWMGSGSAVLGVCYGAEKGPYGYAPTPSTESNTNDIATTEWVRDVGTGLSFPSDRYVDLTLGANGSSYTAPSNGWVMLSKNSTAAGQSIAISSSISTIAVEGRSSASGNNLRVFLPVKEGDTFEVSYSAGGTTNRFRFIYAEGA